MGGDGVSFLSRTSYKRLGLRQKFCTAMLRGRVGTYALSTKIPTASPIVNNRSDSSRI